MTYTITAVVARGEHLITTVRYNFSGRMITTDVVHFQPQTRAEVRQNIVSRATTEDLKLLATDRNGQIVTALQPDIGVEV